ncbi:MAG: hypothetical protein WKG07_45975 [Hymenobacter sp.]
MRRSWSGRASRPPCCATSPSIAERVGAPASCPPGASPTRPATRRSSRPQERAWRQRLLERALRGGVHRRPRGPTLFEVDLSAVETWPAMPRRP